MLQENSLKLQKEIIFKYAFRIPLYMLHFRYKLLQNKKKRAIQEASRNGSDVVLVDTAGHMQDNEPLMRALSKLIYLNNLHTEILPGTWVPALNIFESSLRRRNCAEAR